jgi:methyl-accepting chemotaxis protein
MLKNLKIRNKIIVIFILAGLIPMLLIAVMATIQSRKALRQATYDELELYQEMTQNRIETYMTQKRNEGWILGQTNRVMKSIEMYNLYGKESQLWLEGYAVLEGFIPGYADNFGAVSIFITDESGQVIYASGVVKEQLEAANISIRNYWMEAMAGKANISEFTYSSIIDDYYVAVATPVSDPLTSKVIGTVNMLLPVPEIQGMLQAYAYLLGDTGDVYLIDEEGLLFTNTVGGTLSSEAAFKETIMTKASIDLAKAITEGIKVYSNTDIYDNYDGTSVIGSYGIITIGVTPLGLIAEVEEAEGLSTVNGLILFMIVLTLITLVIAGFLIVFGAGSITKPIQNIVGIAKKIAEGQLDVILEVNSEDEIGELSLAFSNMLEQLNDVLRNINSASEQVASGATQVSDSSLTLSHGATEQASSIEELTASIEEIAGKTRMNATNADKAKEISASTQQHAQKGNEQMAEMLKAMAEINDSSSSISKIIKVIDDIAFQTNILALNAAVEAARAGQHGKGFAVVAEEVRNLAARSANAAKETTTMIEGSIKKVEGGTRIANETAEALNKIVEGVSKATMLITDIASASKEQSIGVDQINQGISQIADVVQTTSATAEETAAASEELSSQSDLLKSQVAAFKLKKIKINQFNEKEIKSIEVLRKQLSYSMSE